MYEEILELRACIKRCQGMRVFCATLPTNRLPGRVRICLIFRSILYMSVGQVIKFDV